MDKVFINDNFWEAYIPDFKYISEVKKPGNKFFSIIIRKGETPVIKKIGLKKFIFNYTADTSTRDIISTIEYVFEYIRNLVSIYCLHSSSTIIGKKLFVFWGSATGVGKTRTAKILSEKFTGKFISDEKSLFSFKTNKYIGGIPKMYTHRSVYDESSLINKKEFVDLNIINLGYTDEIFFIYIHNLGTKSNEKNIFKFSKEEFEWQLYEDLTRKIRGTSRRINNFSFPLPSLDNEKLSIIRSNDVKKFCEKFNCYYVRADENNIISFIKTLL